MKSYRHITARKLTPKEEAFIDLLERQRHRRGYVRVIANDPRGELTRVVCDYVSWIQNRRDRRDALVFTARKSPKLPIPRLFQACARAFRKHQGKPLCIGQVVLFGSDAYCPSVPLWRNYFDQIRALGCGYISLQGTVLIILGNVDARRGRTPFARFYRQARTDDFYEVYGTEASAPPQSAIQRSSPTEARRLRPIERPPKNLFKCEPLVARTLFLPYRPRGAPLAA